VNQRKSQTQNHQGYLRKHTTRGDTLSPWNLDLQVHKLVAERGGVQFPDATAAHDQLVSWLRSSRHFQFNFTLQRGNVDGGTQNSLGYRDRNLQGQAMPASHTTTRTTNGQDAHQCTHRILCVGRTGLPQLSRGRTGGHWDHPSPRHHLVLPASCSFQTPRLHKPQKLQREPRGTNTLHVSQYPTSRDSDFHAFRFLLDTGAVAIATRVRDNGALAMARLAWSCHGEKPLLNGLLRRKQRITPYVQLKLKRSLSPGAYLARAVAYFACLRFRFIL
jgi:hypothetical protein